MKIDEYEGEILSQRVINQDAPIEIPRNKSVDEFRVLEKKVCAGAQAWEQAQERDQQREQEHWIV